VRATRVFNSNFPYDLGGASKDQLQLGSIVNYIRFATRQQMCIFPGEVLITRVSDLSS
jgi:hypothetical protein